MCYPIIPGTKVEYTILKGQSLSKNKDAKYFLFHGSPDITIKRKFEDSDADERVVVVDRGSASDSVMMLILKLRQM